ncbi:hypothetical protein Tco_1153202 [Tanacetum coccineum]
MLARIAKAAALSPSSFCKRYRSSYKKPSPSSSLTLPIRKRYRGTSELIDDTEDDSSDSDAKREGSKDEGHGLKDEGPGLEEEEEDAPEGEGSMPSTFEIGQSSRSVLEQQRVGETPAPRIPMRTTWIDPQDNTVYLDIEIDPRACAPVQTLASPEWSFDSLSVSPSSPIVPLPIASPATTLKATISVDKNQFLEVGAQLELYGSILYDHTQRLDALPPTLFEGYDRDLRELYTSLRQRPMLALEAWTGHVDARKAELWQARYDDHRLIHDLLVQNAAMLRELQEIRGRVATLEQERRRREQ